MFESFNVPGLYIAVQVKGMGGSREMRRTGEGLMLRSDRQWLWGAVDGARGCEILRRDWIETKPVDEQALK